MATPERVEETYEAAETPSGVQTRRTVSAAPEVPGEHPRDTFEKKRVVFRAYQIVWYLLGLVEVLLALRFFLKFAGANPLSGFARFVYNLSEPLAAPFYGLFGVNVTGPSVFEWTTLIAMLVYALVAWGLVALFRLIKPVSSDEVDREV